MNIKCVIAKLGEGWKDHFEFQGLDPMLEFKISSLKTLWLLILFKEVNKSIVGGIHLVCLLCYQIKEIVDFFITFSLLFLFGATLVPRYGMNFKVMSDFLDMDKT
jgi:hypothetical protein